MGFNCFKKHRREPIVKIEEKIVEKLVEVPVPSRFKFAHDVISVVNYSLNTTEKTKYSDITADTVFISNEISFTEDTGNSFYPVFIMPNALPKTRLVTGKKVICVGTIVVDTNDNIKAITDEFTGESLEYIAATLNLVELNEMSDVTIMNMNDVIHSNVIDGDIDLETFERFILLKNNLKLIMNDC